MPSLLRPNQKKVDAPVDILESGPEMPKEEIL
jgi:hypothetical protein